MQWLRLFPLPLQGARIQLLVGKLRSCKLLCAAKKRKRGGGELYYLVSDTDRGDFPGGPVVKNLPANAGDADPWIRKIPWRRERQPTPVSCLENPTDTAAWRATAYGVEKKWTGLSNWARMYVDNEGDFTPVGARRCVGKSLCFAFSFAVKWKLLLSTCILKKQIPPKYIYYI